ncbi:hypothetical protein QFW77_04940, partial [Luteimonas sp. RD2P54]
RPTLDLFFHYRAHSCLLGKVTPEQEITGSLHPRAAHAVEHGLADHGDALQLAELIALEELDQASNRNANQYQNDAPPVANRLGLSSLT